MQPFFFNPDSVVNNDFEKQGEAPLSHQDVFTSIEALAEVLRKSLSIELGAIRQVLSNRNSGYEITIYSCADGRYCAIATSEGYARLIYVDTDYKVVYGKANETFFHNMAATAKF